MSEPKMLSAEEFAREIICCPLGHERSLIQERDQQIFEATLMVAAECAKTSKGYPTTESHAILSLASKNYAEVLKI